MLPLSRSFSRASELRMELFVDHRVAGEGGRVRRVRRRRVQVSAEEPGVRRQGDGEGRRHQGRHDSGRGQKYPDRLQISGGIRH